MRTSIQVLVFCAMLTASAAAAPAIEIPDNEFYFGKTVQQATVRHIFWIKSVGRDTLRIERVAPGCGCTQAPLLDSVLAPGDSTKLEIIFDTKRFRGLTEKKTAIFTNAVDEPKAEVAIIADLSLESEDMRPLVIRPFRVDVSQFTKTPRRRAKFLIENRSDKEYELTIIDAEQLNFEIDLPKKIKPGETLEGTVLVDEDLVEEPFEQSFTFRLNDERGTRYTVPIKREVRIPESKS